MSTFDFENAPSWDVSQGTFIPAGNHVVEITSATGGRSKNNHPQIELEFANQLGEKKDWLTYGEQNGVAKVATLFRAADVQLMNSDVDETTGLIHEAKIQQLVGRKVGVVMRDEPSFKDPTKIYANPKGYLPASEIKPLPTQGQAAAPATVASDQDIAF